MKFYKSFLFIFFLLTISCSKTFDENGFYGEGSANLNKLMFSGSTRIAYNDEFCLPDTCISIQIKGDNIKGGGTIVMNFIPQKLGKFALDPEFIEPEDHLYQFSYYQGADDVLSGSYHIYEIDTSNWIIINKINFKTGDVKGRFQATVIKDKFWLPPNYIPDTLRFTNGEFYGRIFKR